MAFLQRDKQRRRGKNGRALALLRLLPFCLPSGDFVGFVGLVVQWWTLAGSECAAGSGQGGQAPDLFLLRGGRRWARWVRSLCFDSRWSANDARLVANSGGAAERCGGLFVIVGVESKEVGYPVASVY